MGYKGNRCNIEGTLPGRALSIVTLLFAVRFVSLDANSLEWHRMTSKRSKTANHGALNIRDVPRDTLRRLKAAAALEGKTVKDLLLDLIERELSRRGLRLK